MWIIIILAYVANVFLNRWLNKLLYRKCKFVSIVPILWFIPVVGIIVTSVDLLIELIHDLLEGKTNKFTGKHW